MLIPLHGGVNLYRWTHRRGERDGLEVPALDRRGSSPLELLAQGEVVLDQAIEVEGLLADHAVDDAVAVDAVLDLAALDLLDGPTHIHRYRAALRVGHEAPGTKDLAKRTDDPHLVGGGDRNVEVHKPLVADAGSEVLGAHDVGPGLPRLPGLLALGEDRDPPRSEEHTSELQSRQYLVCRLLLEKKKNH